MPTKVGIHDFSRRAQEKSWMPTFVGMTVGAAAATHSRVIVHGAWYYSVNNRG
jgi:uncharacterized protein (DUF2062 family)